MIQAQLQQLFRRARARPGIAAFALLGDKHVSCTVSTQGLARWTLDGAAVAWTDLQQRCDDY